MTPEKTIILSCGGKLTYRLPNCIEQIRFFVDTRWNNHKLLLEQVEAGIPFVGKFVTKIESDNYEEWNDILIDRSNYRLITDLVMDIGAQSIGEDKKKS